ncbi:DMSO/TMAO reductase YedYZ molybdopterin-dependent catalytic subunit/uncharacterized membrane protein YhaH (DUF805 family) [Halorubrum alkaliphilum]|uniref:DMSO/TMAO reductase YedYZ molybdopterin-dependent catalytic subunit/uncharacterized membrane protein YhaH (DUF805 family) n=1 Tax=Halorubrum alkaliphilum TaxID=261290 RepID=A0A8T4GFT6_9EURY|nr:molybdopterin-dependent oxidoreductase [Halorubrum alkaliphilum]MBP1922510.1 DMSO/TMAO reductase YedYZ molybdopterin-dependent catalytic subunit/uncharacterized membrane protein YhaH (DUF805 family) [Halorubrum alkaliphilum]
MTADTADTTATVTAGSATRRGLVGAAIGAAWIAGLFAASPLVGGFAVETIAESVIVSSPGWLSTAAVSTLGFYATPVLVASVTAVLVAIPAAILTIRPLPERGSRTVAVASLVVTVPVLYAVGSGVSAGFLVAVVLCVAAPAVVASGLRPTGRPQTRRRFLRRVGAYGVVSVLAGVGLRTGFDRLVGPGVSERAGEPLPESVTPPEGDPAFAFDGMPTAITEYGDHYVVDINVNPPAVDLDAWRLDVEGAVDEPYSLTYDELLDHDDRVEQPTTMLCISNPVGGGLIGTGHWTGVQLSDLVAAAAPNEAAVSVVTHAADGYSEAIPFDLVEREDVLIAYGMDDRTLEPEHGFPARLLIPGRYGMKMTKWIDRIELREEEHEAYWEERGWDEQAVVNPMSYVRGAERDGDEVVVGGVAFAGLETGVEEISGVEVSVDGGETWETTELEPQIAAHAWRRWRHTFDAPGRSEFEVVARAVLRDGTVQTDVETSPRPSGATGWHRETVSVE